LSELFINNAVFIYFVAPIKCVYSERIIGTYVTLCAMSYREYPVRCHFAVAPFSTILSILEHPLSVTSPTF